MKSFVWAFLGGGLFLSIGGCASSSSDTRNDSQAGAANAGNLGGTHAGGASVGASGSAGTPGTGGGAGALVLGDSKTEACIAYAVASCERHAVCRNESTADCISFSNSCPDLVFSAGSTRTIAGVKACAAEFASFSCERLANGESPDCVTPGTRKPGERCSFASQCQGLDCKGDCGVCASLGAEEDSCAGAAASCGAGLYCSEAKQKCLLLPTATMPSKFDGKACITNADCGSAGYCPSASHTCARLPSNGMSCAESLDCDIYSYCGASSKTCRLFQGLGQACGSDAAATANPYCQTGVGIVCDYTTKTSGTCVKIPVAGEPCTRNEAGEPVSECAGGAHCDGSGFAPKCVVGNSLGSPCQARSECAAGLDCDCPGGADLCSAKVCVQWQLAGQPCAGGSSICHPGFACMSGVCEPIDTRNLFADSCPSGPP